MAIRLQVYRPYRPCQAISCNVLGLSINPSHNAGYVGHDPFVGTKSQSTRTPAAEGWGKRLAWLQSCSKLNQTGFALAIDVDPGMFSKWVNERIPYGPNASTLDGIVTFFNVQRRYWITDFVLKNECRKEIEAAIEQWDPGPPANVNTEPAPVTTQHHPCPALTRFMTHCYQRKEVVADALMTAMDDYVDRYGGTEMVGEPEERKRQDGQRGALPKT